MGNLSFFDEVASVGTEVLNQLSGKAAAGPYLRRVRDVYQLLGQVHSDLLIATVEVGSVGTLDEGRHVLQSLSHDALESVFRARRWCDELRALGRDLRTVPPDVAAVNSDTWQRFTAELEQGEGEVAMLYEQAMREVIYNAEIATTLKELQEYMATVANELVLQKAKFDVLAIRAESMARRQ